jgi:NADH pyrophosphatase NudC (nudix superfamily)
VAVSPFADDCVYGRLPRRRIRLDENEIAEARWFGPGDAWPEATSSVSISALLVRAHRPPAV